jgi:hypothetical protein
MAFAHRFFLDVDDSAFLLDGRGPIFQYQPLPGADPHGQSEQTAMRVDFKRVCLFFDWNIAFELRANQDGNLQQHSLRAAAVGRINGILMGDYRHDCIQLNSEQEFPGIDPR